MYHSNTKTKGDLAELEVISFLVRNGYKVSIPYGENAPYDLVVESPTHHLYRVQVRSSCWKQEVLTLSLRVVSKNYTKTLDRSRIEVFALFDGESVFLIPTQHTESCVAAFSIRRTLPLNKQTVGIRHADTYREALSFLP